MIKMGRSLLRTVDSVAMRWARDQLLRPWSDLRGISNSHAAKSTVLIPLVGYWILFNSRLVAWTNLAKQIVGDAAIDHISSRAIWFYMALCAIAAGTMIYAVRCPREVKKYGDYEDYVNGDGSAMSTATMIELEREIESKGYELIGAVVGKEDILELNYLELNKSRPFSRAAVLLLFVVGFSILTWLSGQVFFIVMHLLYIDTFG